MSSLVSPYFLVCFLLFFLGPHRLVLRVYSSSVLITPGRPRGPYGMQEIEPGSATCESGALPAVLSLWPIPYFESNQFNANCSHSSDACLPKIMKKWLVVFKKSSNF